VIAGNRIGVEKGYKILLALVRNEEQNEHNTSKQDILEKKPQENKAKGKEKANIEDFKEASKREPERRKPNKRRSQTRRPQKEGEKMSDTN
jgi:hypothetical protein